MALFASTAAIETYVRSGRDDSPEGRSERSCSHEEEYFSDSDRSSASSRHRDNDADSEQNKSTRGAFGDIFGSTNRSVDYHSSSDGVAKGALENSVGDINKYWQNYDLSISEAPKLFSDEEFEAVKRIQQALAVLLLRKRLKNFESSPFAKAMLYRTAFNNTSGEPVPHPRPELSEQYKEVVWTSLQKAQEATGQSLVELTPVSVEIKTLLEQEILL